jgi:nitroreductase
MQKPAITDYPVQDYIRNRWSPRAFSEQAVSPEVLRSLFEAARWAPSSNNEQPWAFLVATRDDPENFARMLSVLVEFNAGWAKSAGVLVLAVAELAFRQNGQPNRNAQYDVGSATAQMTFEACSRGLAVHQMAGFYPKKARQVFEIPDGWDPIAAIAIGYPGDASTLPQKLRDREVAPRSRRPLREFVMTGSWGHTAPFVAK